MKKILAIAIASAFAAPAFAATANVDIYGIMHVAVEDTNVTGQDIAVVDRVSRFGFKGSEDLGGGLHAIWQIESALGSSSTGGLVGGAGSFATRDTFVGLKGGFGTVLLGRNNTPYKNSTGKLDLFADTAADYNLGGVGITQAAKNQIFIDDGISLADRTLINSVFTTSIGFGYINAVHDYRSPASIVYVSPDFSGLSFSGALVATNNAAAANANKSIDAKSFSANYTNGPLLLAAGWQKMDAIDSDSWKVGAGYNFGNAKIGAIYEKTDLFGIDSKTYLLNGAYSMGAITLKGQFAKSSVEDLDGKMWVLGADYNLSKRTVAYALYSSDKADRVDYVAGNYVSTDDAIKTFAVGVKHSF